jgi:hypothetical protein
LLATIKQDALAIALRTNFAWAPVQTTNDIVLDPGQFDVNMINKLQEAASSVPAYNAQAMAQPWFDATASRYAQAFAWSDDIEVIDMNNTPQATNDKKYNRNDQVVIVWPGGEEKEMKYKKAEELLAKGWRIK